MLLAYHYSKLKKKIPLNFHYHYINKERTLGGHVFDLNLVQAQLQMQKSHEFMLQVFETDDFYQCNLDVDIPAVLKKIE